MRFRVLLAAFALLLGFVDAGRDFYGSLGISRGADEATIKRAYRKLALKYHPDKNPEEKKEAASKKFSEVSAAYDILSDPEKKRVYDAHGEEGLKHTEQQQQQQQQWGGQQQFHFGGGGFGRQQNPFDMFNQHFGGGFGGHQQQQQQQSGPLYESDSPVTSLRQGKFPGHDAKNVWLVEFYAPWCGHCQQMKPTWEALANELSGVVKVGAVNCDTEKALCTMHSATSFPTVKLFRGGASLAYDGGRDLEGYKRFALDNLPTSQLSSLSARRPESVDAMLQRPESVKPGTWNAAVVVIHREVNTPDWLKVLSYSLRGKLAFGEARAGNEGVAPRFGVSSLPAVVGVCGGDAERTLALPIHGGRIFPEAVEHFAQSFKDPTTCAGVGKRPKVELQPGADYSKMRVGELQAILASLGERCALCVEKSDFVKRVQELAQQRNTGAAGAGGAEL